MLYPLTVMVIAGAIQLSASASDTKYTTRYDNIDIDGILKSERLLRSYYNCLLDKGPCTREGLELKSELICCFTKLRSFKALSFKIT